MRRDIRTGAGRRKKQRHDAPFSLPTDMGPDMNTVHVRRSTPDYREQSTETHSFATELEFYDTYTWCLNAYPDVKDTIQYLGSEIEKLRLDLNDWQTHEVATNIFLLSCGLLHAVEEYLRGPSVRIPGRLMTRLGPGAMWAMDGATRVVERAANIRSGRNQASLRDWQERWQASLGDFLAILVKGQPLAPASFAGSAACLTELLVSPPLPADLQAKQVAASTLFRRLDTTHYDIMALGQRFADRCPDRSQAILIVGLRTSGSYFAPLLQACLKAEGYQEVVSLTIHPGKGPGRWERQQLHHCARQGFTALVVDDSPYTAGTIVLALDIVRRAGFSLDKLKALVPYHPARRDCLKVLSDQIVISIEPEQWHKYRLLDPKLAEQRLAEYFQAPDVLSVRLVASKAAEDFNAGLQNLSSGDRGARLKGATKFASRDDGERRPGTSSPRASAGGGSAIMPFSPVTGSPGSSRPSSDYAMGSFTWSGILSCRLPSRRMARGRNSSTYRLPMSPREPAALP
ncbi:hypothetical protein BIWAKO_06475 [Bosea sp. BIWAKO-01]|nr:hypothetical protein BIWAKO_06475 [Bosea sp. BIWAKO-01]